MLRIAVAKRLRDISIDIDDAFPAGTSVLLGPSGHGKTSILNMIAGIIRPDRGQIAIGDRVLYDSRRRIDVAIEQRGIGYVFQDFALFPHLSIFENIAYGLRARHLPRRIVRERVDRELRRFQIDKLREALPARISAGQRQRVALARTLVLEPSTLLLDEPLSALDPPLRVEVRAELAELFHRLSVPTLIVTHDPADARRLADRILIVENGRMTEVADLDHLESHRPTWLRLEPADAARTAARGRAPAREAAHLERIVA